MNTLDPDWSALVTEIGPKLYRYFCGNFPPQLASDLVQDTLLRLVEKQEAGSYDENRGGFTSYAFGIARFVRLEALKNSRTFDLVSGANQESEISVEPKANQPDSMKHLRWAISQLGIMEQEILLRMIDQEVQQDQIAEELGLPIGTIKSHVHRAKEKLKVLMETHI